MRNEYLTLRRPYEPDNVKLIVVAESPPASGKYFYNPEGRITEPLFAAMIKQLGFSCTNKANGLLKFQQCGWVLVDATYEPVNKLNHSGKIKVIERDYPLLRDDLARMTPDRLTPLVLIKANVCQFLEPKLLKDKFNVLNGGIRVPFPSTGQQKQFREKLGEILKNGIGI